MMEILRDFFTNQIIVDWIAPIITGLIVIVIPGIVVKTFQTKKDERIVEDANKRYLNSIRPYIIQKINIDKSFITDVRKVIIKESCIKEKYIYTEVQLRNKLIIDITEDNYINEKNKIDLINFTYSVFKEFKNNEIINKESNKGKVKIDKFIITFVVTLIICALIQITSAEGTDLHENMTFTLSYVASFFSFFILIISNFHKSLKSEVSSKSNLRGRINNIFFEEVDDSKKVKDKKKDVTN